MTLNRKPTGVIRPSSLATAPRGVRSSQPALSSPQSASPMVSNRSLKASTPNLRNGNRSSKDTPLSSPASTPGTPPFVASPTTSRAGIISGDGHPTGVAEKSRRNSAGQIKSPVATKIMSPTTRRASCAVLSSGSKEDSGSNGKASDAQNSGKLVFVQKRKTSNVLANMKKARKNSNTSNGSSANQIQTDRAPELNMETLPGSAIENIDVDESNRVILNKDKNDAKFSEGDHRMENKNCSPVLRNKTGIKRDEVKLKNLINQKDRSHLVLSQPSAGPIEKKSADRLNDNSSPSQANKTSNSADIEGIVNDSYEHQNSIQSNEKSPHFDSTQAIVSDHFGVDEHDGLPILFHSKDGISLLDNIVAAEQKALTVDGESQMDDLELAWDFDRSQFAMQLSQPDIRESIQFESGRGLDVISPDDFVCLSNNENLLNGRNFADNGDSVLLSPSPVDGVSYTPVPDSSCNVSLLEETVSPDDTEDLFPSSLECSDISINSTLNSLCGQDSSSLNVLSGLENFPEKTESPELNDFSGHESPTLSFLRGQERSTLNFPEGQAMSLTEVTGRKAPVASTLAEPSTKPGERDSAITLHFDPDIVHSSKSRQTERSELHEVHVSKINSELICPESAAEGYMKNDSVYARNGSLMKCESISEHSEGASYLESNSDEIGSQNAYEKVSDKVIDSNREKNSVFQETDAYNPATEEKETDFIPDEQLHSVSSPVNDVTPPIQSDKSSLNSFEEIKYEKKSSSDRGETMFNLENDCTMFCETGQGEEVRVLKMGDNLSNLHLDPNYSSVELLHSVENCSITDLNSSMSFENAREVDSSASKTNLKSTSEIECLCTSSKNSADSATDDSRPTRGQLPVDTERGLNASHSRSSLGDSEQVLKDDQCEGESTDVTNHCNSVGAVESRGLANKSGVDSCSKSSSKNVIGIDLSSAQLKEEDKAETDLDEVNFNENKSRLLGRRALSSNENQASEECWFNNTKELMLWKSASFSKFIQAGKGILPTRGDGSVSRNETFSPLKDNRSRPFSVEDIYSATQFYSLPMDCQEQEPLSLPIDIGFVVEACEKKCASSPVENNRERETNEAESPEVKATVFQKPCSVKTTQRMPRQLSYPKPSQADPKTLKKSNSKSVGKLECVKSTSQMKKVSSSTKISGTRDGGTVTVPNSFHHLKVHNTLPTNNQVNSVLVASEKTGSQDKPSFRQAKRKLTAVECSDKKRSATQSKTSRSKGSTVSNGGRRGSEVASGAPPTDASPATKGSAAPAGGPATPAGGSRAVPRTSVLSAGDKPSVAASRVLRSDALKPGQPLATRRPGVTSRAAEPVKTARSTRSASAVASDTAELKRLEAALSAKSSEVEEAKREAQEARNEACEAGKGLQALTVLVHHLTKQYEAFSNPLLKTEIARLQKCLQEAEHALGESRNALEAAETRLSEEQASAALRQQQLSEEHEGAVQQLRQQHEQQQQQLIEQHQLRLEDLHKKHEGDTVADREKHQQEVERLRAEHEQKLTSLVHEHQEKLQALSDDVDRLKKFPQNGVCHDVSSQVSDLSAAHAEREQELQAHSLNLQKEGEKLKERNKKLHESLLSDTDHRLVGIRQHCSDLQKEVDSLKSVVEMRNCELHKLRAQVLTMEQLERDLEAARHLAKTLQAKTEDLNAQMNTKAQTERQLMQSNLQLKETMDRESSANKQLRLENEQLQWKLRQREQLSHSLPPSSLDGMSRISHLNTSWQDRPASLHHQQHVFREEQQSLSRSGSIREEKGPLTSSPVHASFAGKRDSVKCNSKDSYDEHYRMRGTFDGLSPPSSPCVKAVVEKSNSVSFVLDLNDSLSDDSYLDFPASPRMKHATPVLGRRGIQKSRSSSLEKKPGTKVGRSNSLSKCTSTGNFFSRLRSKEVKPNPQKLSTDSDGDQQMQSDGSVVREHTTSESSCGAESVERVSPHGMSWTVPVDDCSSSSPRSPKLDSSRGCFSSLRHLHQPEEDEYEENLEENEEGFISGIPSDLTPLVNLMNASSSSPSDSELSHCGSQAGLTSESEEESSLAESCDRVGDSLSPVAEWVSTVGAGEAMVPSELVSNCCESESTDSSDQIITKDSIPNSVMASELDSTEATPNNPISGCTVVTGSANQKRSLRQN